MYYPLLRGKQFELKALREFSNKYPNTNRIVPIIEPVNKNLGPLIQGIDEMLTNVIRKSYNSRKWLRKFGIFGGVLLGITVFSQFLFGKSEKRKEV